MKTSVAEVPVDDQEATFLVHGRSSDYQDASVQGAVTYRVRDPEKLADRIDFSLDLTSGAFRKNPLEAISDLVGQLAEQIAVAWITSVPLVTVLTKGPPLLRESIEGGLVADEALKDLGLEVAKVRIVAVKPLPELERALEAPARERIQQEADEAGFTRRALAVEKERAIQENELKNQIELARREEELISQRGKNEQRRIADEAEAERVKSEGELARRRRFTETKADLVRIEASSDAEKAVVEAKGKAEAIRLVEAENVTAEKERLAAYRELPPHVLAGMAAQVLAGKLQKIDHIRIEPDTLANLADKLGLTVGAAAAARK